MSEDAKVYIVTQGSYSDYHICAVFSQGDLAEAFVAAFGKQDYEPLEIEEWRLDPYSDDLRGDARVPYFVCMARDGTVTEMRREDSAYGFGGGESTGFDVDRQMYTHCFARDGEHAAKIANERRVQLIAENQWPGDVQPAATPGE